MEKVNKLLESFLNAQDRDFDRFFYEHIEKNVKNREDYVEVEKIRHNLMEKYPRLMELFDRDKVSLFSEEENEALLDIVRAESDRHSIDRREAFKLGFKEAIIFFIEQGMLKI